MTVPLAFETYRARLDGLAAPRRYAVAVSGGRDSMALMRLAAVDAKAGADVVALTVDHGLRDGSRAEAEQTGRWARAAGLDHRILVWEGDKPSAGKQEAARRARYLLLASEAERLGFPAILAAHTADDQAETVFMRLARGAGPQGLSGMAPVSRIAAGPGAPLALLRPFLDATREETGATCAAFGQPYADDPSNDDPAYERVRARALLAALEEQKLLTRDALLKTAARARAAAERLAAAEARVFAGAGGCFHAGGWASLAASRLDRSAAAMVARLIGAVSGSEHPPGEADAAAALEALAASGAATLGGALLKRRGGTVFVMREPAALLGRAGVDPLPGLPLPAGGRALWDGRFIAENSGPAAVLAPLGPAGLTHPARGLFDAPDEALLGAPDALFASSGAIALKPLAEERFFAPVLRFC
ncbi:MAG: tRNA lysidine(34) synthetase TilS [Pseudomonadota bacterium]|nr:tRNA lysidine(34) synthetase TilS [Pseudomonadota bacterium]